MKSPVFRAAVLIALAFFCADCANQVSSDTPGGDDPNADTTIPPGALPTGALSLRGNPSFDAGSLTAEETKWYNRIFDGIDGCRNLIDGYASGSSSVIEGQPVGDVYAIGREVGNYTEALLMALRATGDLRFLDRVYEVSELYRGSLRDAWLDAAGGTTDGYTDWLWIADSGNATFYGKDTNWLDESISSGNVALVAYAMQVNRDLNPKYAASTDFWRDWLENQFLAKWYQRAPVNSENCNNYANNMLCAWNEPFAAFYKFDVEPRSSNWRLAYYLWKITGNSFYKDRVDEIVDQLIQAMQVNPNHPTAYRWSWRLDLALAATDGWEDTTHGNYYSRVTMEMSIEGMPFYSDPTEMARFAATYRDVVYGPYAPDFTQAGSKFTQMAATMNGDDGPVGFAPHANSGFARWDTTGFLMNMAEHSITGKENFAAGGNSKGARNDVYISSYALMAISQR
ncbi:MAG: hypothetical protein V1798_08300 [Pseudomonadota bacterium]